MGRIFGMLGAGAGYFALATALSASLIVTFLAIQGRFSGDSGRMLLALLQGADPASLAPPPPVVEAKEEQTSLTDVAAAKAQRQRDLELREQQVQRDLDLIAARKQDFINQKRNWETSIEKIESDLEKAREGASAEGEENVRSIISGMKPKQAKETLLVMLQKEELEEVVALLAEMPANKRNKIVAEFKSAEEIAKIDEILRHMRAGAQGELADQAPAELGAPRTAGR